MKVVSDTSPICYLLLIDAIHLLPVFFGEVLIPHAVRLELANRDAPGRVREWIKQPPSWLRILPVIESFDPELDRLHSGELEAILLAQQLGADLILLDEKEARRIAAKRGLKVAGLLGILDEAATLSMVDLSVAVENLCRTNFRASPRLLKMLLDKHLS